MKGKGLVIGWREWISLPDFGVTVKAKIDTGAKTSAIHAADIVVDGERVSFTVFPHQHDDTDPVTVTATLLDVRTGRPVLTLNAQETATRLTPRAASENDHLKMMTQMRDKLANELAEQLKARIRIASSSIHRGDAESAEKKIQ